MWWAIALAPVATTLVVGLGDTPLDDVELAALAGDTVLGTSLSHAALLDAWMGPASPNAAADAAPAWVELARVSEARFELAEAHELRERVLRAYYSARRPSAALRDSAAQALADLAAAAWHADDENAAQHAAALAHLFPSHAPDALRFSPVLLERFAQARSTAAAAPHGQLEIHTPLSGFIWIEGYRLPVEASVSVRVPKGSYRVWVERAGDMSWPHRVDIETGATQTITIDPRLDACTAVEPAIRLTCPGYWLAHLESLRQRAQATRVVGIAAPTATRPARLIILPLPAPQAPGPMLTMAVARPAVFSPWSLVPVGIGQFAQQRTTAGGIYLGAEASLAAWHATTLYLHQRALAENNQAREPGLRAQRNVSAALLYSALIAGVIDAVVWGAMP